MKLAMLLAIIIAVHHLKATLSASAEGQKGFCSCWSSFPIYTLSDHTIRDNITLHSCPILYDRMDFELDVHLSGSKQYINEENYVITCDPLKTVCPYTRRFWFPRQQCVHITVMLRPTCPQDVHYDTRCRCRPYQAEWTVCNSSISEGNTRPLPPTDNPTTSNVKKEYIIIGGVVIFIFVCLVVLSVMYQNLLRNRPSERIHQQERMNNNRLLLETTST